MNWKLIEHIPIRYTMKCVSGLRIGGSKDDVEIGGMDNPILRDPITKEPYVPGSSLKGKIRSLLEYREGKIDQRGEPCGCARQDCMVCKVFGPHKQPNHGLGPTRILFRDAPLVPDSRTKLASMSVEGINYAEIKTENIINRATGVAANAGLRTQERVPAGTEFQFSAMLRVFDGDDKEAMIKFIEDGIDLLQNEYLGGSGSRGYGEIQFTKNE